MLGVVLDFFLSFTFTFSHPIKKSCWFYLQKYPQSNQFSPSPLLSTSLNHLFLSWTIALLSLCALPRIEKLEHVVTLLKTLQWNSTSGCKVKISCNNPEGSWWHSHPHCHYLSDFLSCDIHPWSLCFHILDVLTHAYPWGTWQLLPLCLEHSSPR